MPHTLLQTSTVFGDEIPVDFDALDEFEAATADHAREVLTGLPARPGTRR